MGLGTRAVAQGLAQRVRGRKASRVQAFAAAVAAGVVVYRTLGSGSGEEETSSG